jgi:radical SAM protein (TIGR01212 family)
MSENIFESLHYNAIAPWLKNRFSQRVVKPSLDGGFTCPNRDGRCGTGGCSFCPEDGSGAFAGSIPDQMELLRRKWPDAGLYIAYFQNHTNTYAPVPRLRELWDEALTAPGVIGLAAATRPDCLGEDVLDLISEYSKKTFLWIELGLQTSSDATARAFNRGYDSEVFASAMEKLSRRGIRTVVHLILGLPGEDRAAMLESARFAASKRPFGIKLHMLHLMKNTRMGREYEASPWPLMTQKEYVDTVVDILERLPQDITIHRLTGDAPQSELIAPQWSRNKHAVLNAIQREFKARGSFQGMKGGAFAPPRTDQ